MKKVFDIPSIGALIAFESAARLENFSHAALERSTSQSAISRHIIDIESQLGIKLFDRLGKKVVLTDQGKSFYKAITFGLNSIQNAMNVLKEKETEKQVTITCSHEISHLYLMPKFEMLRSKLGDNVNIRVMTYQSGDIEKSLDTTKTDIVLGYQIHNTPEQNQTVLFKEAVCPVCSPAFSRKFGLILNQKNTLHRLPLLELQGKGMGKLTWLDYFAHHGLAPEKLDVSSYHSYVYLLEAAMSGKGVALAWRGCIERYLENKGLVMVDKEYMVSENYLHAMLTSAGSRNEIAWRCFDFFKSLSSR